MSNSFSCDQKILEIVGKIGIIEEQLGEGKDTPPVLLSVHRKSELENEKDKLYDTFSKLLIEADRIEIRTSPNGKDHADLVRFMLNVIDIDTLWDAHYEYILDFHESTELLDRGTFINNYYKLVPPYVRFGVNIPQGIKDICHESRWSYVYGQCSASLSLSRTVVETILKHKFNLKGKLDEIIEAAKKQGLISEQSAWNANKVRRLANRVLHEARPATEKEAKNALDHVLNFIEEIYLE